MVLILRTPLQGLGRANRFVAETAATKQLERPAVEPSKSLPLCCRHLDSAPTRNFCLVMVLRRTMSRAAGHVHHCTECQFVCAATMLVSLRPSQDGRRRKGSCVCLRGMDVGRRGVLLVVFRFVPEQDPDLGHGKAKILFVASGESLGGEQSNAFGCGRFSSDMGKEWQRTQSPCRDAWSGIDLPRSSTTDASRSIKRSSSVGLSSRAAPN